MTSVIEAFPIRTKGIHFINPSSGFDALFKLFHGFLSKKIQERIKVHDSFEALHQVVPKKYLPEEYGGSGGRLHDIIEDWRKTLVANRAFFAEDAKYRNDERKRLGKPKNASTLFGVEGMFNIRPISPQLKEVARQQLNEDESQVDSHLKVIRSWLIELDLQSSLVDDQFLVAFLRGCKFSLEKVKKKILLFYQIRSELPQIIQNRDPLDSDVLRIIRMGVGVPLPKTEKPTDPKLFIIRVGCFDVNHCTFADIMKVGTMINDILMRDDDQMVICGMALIIDLKGVTANHLMHFEIDLLRKVAVLNQDASPLRMQGIHILHPPSGAQTVLNIFNGLLSEKNQHKRIYSHGSDQKSLYQHFSPSILPKEYGGNLESIDTLAKQWEAKLIDNRSYLLDMALSNLHPCPSPNSVSKDGSKHRSFGTEGSFRKLDFD
uniref:CRAL-TRIO domain-containing protein n=1 Tax=Anopheles christyi TaxID=43041 RepID=A0A182K802_9DIPT